MPTPSSCCYALDSGPTCWKFDIVAGADFYLFSGWDNASHYMGMPDLADHAITALTLPVTSRSAGLYHEGAPGG
jgi:hypothetical protein